MDTFQVEQLDLAALPSLEFSKRNTLPNIPAIYFVISQQHGILYIGRTKHLRMRWNAHHRMNDFTAHDDMHIAWLVTSHTRLLPEIEEVLIDHFKPLYQCQRPNALPMVKMCLYLDESLWEAFRILCLKRHVSASKQVTHFIEAHLRTAVDQGITSAEASGTLSTGDESP